jgi:class 3 adenylate cyclase
VSAPLAGSSSASTPVVICGFSRNEARHAASPEDDIRRSVPDDLPVRADLPTGTVTFLFTDVEGSTRLLDEFGTEAWAAYAGVEVDTAGDAFFVAFARVSDAKALALYSESLQLCREIDDPRLIAYCLQGGASVFAARGDRDNAATMLGGAAAICARLGMALTPDEQAEVDAVEAECRAALSPDAFARAWDEGAALDADAAADWALQLWARSE